MFLKSFKHYQSAFSADKAFNINILQFFGKNHSNKLSTDWHMPFASPTGEAFSFLAVVLLMFD